MYCLKFIYYKHISSVSLLLKVSRCKNPTPLTTRPRPQTSRHFDPVTFPLNWMTKRDNEDVSNITYESVWLDDDTMLFITSRYSPLTCCSDDTAVVWVWTLWRTVRWRWRINVELIVQHVSTVCQTQSTRLATILRRTLCKHWTVLLVFIARQHRYCIETANIT